MQLQDLLNHYGRYISLQNQELLSKNWKKLSQYAQNAFVFQLEQAQMKEIQFLSRALEKDENLYNVISTHISQERIDSLHKIEQK